MGYEVIKKIAKEKGISLESISKHANISYNSLSKIIRNTVKTPRYDTVKHIAEALNMSIDELSNAIEQADKSTIELTQEEKNKQEEERKIKRILDANLSLKEMDLFLELIKQVRKDD